MKKTLFIAILSTLIAANSSQKCACSQLLTKADCENITQPLQCTWNTTKQICSIPNTLPVKKYTTYCDSFAQTTCPQIKECAWLDGACIPFTACIPFLKVTHADCKAISSRCITDGTHCVEITTCDAFLKQTACLVDQNGDYCYWDAMRGCIDAKTCDQLPVSFKTDQQCRDEISTCTTTGVGCKKSGTDCKDQISEASCKYNLNMKQSCFWNGNQCLDAICINAPKSYTSDKACIEFQADGKCTTQQGGGCVTRGNCDDAKIQAACITNNQGSRCFWNGLTCQDLICANAPKNYKTNSACQVYLASCITNGNGCIENSDCSTAKIEIACDKSIYGTLCIWDKQTCIDKTCDNAPKVITSNVDCEYYLPKGNCIAKIDGGCITNTTCSAIKYDKACLIDSIGTVCFWDQDASTCKDKTCSNAPISYKDDYACYSYLKSCTVNSSGAGCVERTCENLLSRDLCTNNLNGEPCIYKGICYQKQCSFAPNTYNSHDQCKEYLSSCTLNTSGFGCTSIPLICSANSHINCYQKKTINKGAEIYSDCGWNGNSCIDKNCYTIDKIVTKTLECNQAILGCVSANPINGIVEGCIDLPINCAGRRSSDNCQVIKSGYPTCLWNLETSQCMEQTCLTALIKGLPGVLNSATRANCAIYMKGIVCLVSNDGNSCMAQVQSCSQLQSGNNCGDGAKINGENCYWTGSKCLDKICSNINLTSHQDCNQILSTCTVNAVKSACIPLEDCATYTIEEQCVINALNQLCTWDSVQNKCINTQCAFAPNSNKYVTDNDCQNFLTSDGPCTVISSVGSKGCVQKQANCSDYIDSNQCFNTISDIECVWSNNKCWIKDQLKCSEIVLGTYSDTNCEYVTQSCKANITKNGCVNKVCSDYKDLSSNEECQLLDSSCVWNTQNPSTCQIRKANCSDYETIYDCTLSTAGQCIWSTNNNPQKCILSSSSICENFVETTSVMCKSYGFCKPKSDKTCVKANTCEEFVDIDGKYTFDVCYNGNPQCVNANDNKSCVTPSTCETYTSQARCNLNKEGKKCFWNQSNCITITADNCTIVILQTGKVTRQCCQNFNDQCTAARDGSQCIPIREPCSQITNLNFCVESTKSTCVQNQLSDNGATCIAVTAETSCEKLYFGQTMVYSFPLCYLLKPGCTTNNNGTGCTDKKCSNASNTFLQDCSYWMRSCTADSLVSPTSCIEKASTCAKSNSQQCPQSSLEGQCTIVNGLCMKRTCETASFQFTEFNDVNCSLYLDTCTVARVGGCQARLSSCSSYLTQIQCVKDAAGQSCIWNTQTLSCIDHSCAKKEQFGTYQTHKECNDALNTCTIKSSNGTVAKGCQTLGTCSSYIQAQCFINQSRGACAWNKNIVSPACQDKSCATAPKSDYTTHQQCQTYLLDGICTVAVVIDNGGVYKEQGCQTLSDCSSYLSKEQCKIDTTKNECGWNGTACANKSCISTSSDYDTDQKCQAYLAGCTVNSTKTGCIPVSSCGSYTISEQCVRDQNGAACYWVPEQGICIVRFCCNAPSNITDAAGCDSYLSGCTMDEFKCRTKTCEDINLNTDSLCSKAQSTCTSNGINCVLRGTCSQALTKVGCVTSSDGKKCQWIESNAYCTIRNCSTAPIDLITESACQSYYTGCTAKTGGGCIEKSYCEVSSQAACTKDINGIPCFWDTSFCRKKVCSDYIGWTHESCQYYSLLCTAGDNGYCTTITTCAQTTNPQGCIIGTDGPCLWVSGQTDKSVGVCLKYSECSSIAWTTHAQCNQISNYCTTDGQKCVGITLCSETNTNGGCVIGSDGPCIQTVEFLNSPYPPKCYAFTSCEQAFYSTHSDCQRANSKCTTNGKGCIALSSCTSYNSISSCVIDNIGIVLNQGIITSTGQCKWDQQACRDLNCIDLTGTTHTACYSKLSNCTSNGKNCIFQSICSTYSTQTACITALGTDGICFWQENGSCTAMTNCDFASKNQAACLAAIDFCAWKITIPSSTTYSCVPHTCDTYQSSHNQKCQNFIQLDQNSLQFCIFNGVKCIETDPATLPQATCFSASSYTYYWNPASLKCTSCSSQKPYRRTSINNSNSKNRNATISEYILGFVIVVVIYIVV